MRRQLSKTKILRRIGAACLLAFVLLSSSNARTAEAQNAAINEREPGGQIVDVTQELDRTDYNIYLHPAVESRDEFDQRFGTATLSYFERCNICDPSGLEVPGAGYQLKIFSKDQDPTCGGVERSRCTADPHKVLFDKPILVTQGFDVNFGLKGQFDYQEFERLLSSVYDPKDSHLVCDDTGLRLGNCAEINLLRQLYDEGYDIALLLWKNPLIDIKTNALVTLQALRWLQEYTNSSEGSEPVVIGPSLGGLVTRYALQLAGDRRAIGSTFTVSHGFFIPEIIRARLFIAFDSPNRGAEIPMSLQAFVSYFRNTDADLKQVFSNLTSVAARQLLLSSVKDKDTGGVCQQNVDYEDPTPVTIGDCVTGNDHAIFMQKINEPAFREQIKGIVHQSAGTLQAIHTAAVINGSGIGMPVGYSTEARLYATQDHTGTVHLDFRGGSSSFFASRPPVQVFNGDIAPHFGTTLSCIFAKCADDKASFHYFFGEPAWVENAPGGLRNTFAFIINKVQEKSSWDRVDAEYTDTTLNFEPGSIGIHQLPQYPFGNHAFIPTLSSLGLLDRDINDNAQWFRPYREDSQQTRNDHGTTGPCNEPCMFDDVFAPEHNQRHVTVTTDNKKWFLDLIHDYGPQAADIKIVGAGASPNPVTAGNPVKLSFDFTFNGPDGALNPTVSVTLPEDVTVSPNSLSPSNVCNEVTIASPHSVSCSFEGNFVGGVHIELVVIPTKAGNITIFAKTVSLREDPNPLNNSATVDILVNPSPSPLSADLAFERTIVSPDPVRVGIPLTYDLVFSNNGPGTASDVTVTDTLPQGVTFVSASGCSEADGTVTCRFPSLASGNHFGPTIVVIPNVVGTLTNTARATSLASDPNPGNNEGTANTLVRPVTESVADLAFERVIRSPDPVRVGIPLTYDLVFINNGPGTASDITVTDTLPPGVTLISAPGCSEAGGTVTCRFGNLGSGTHFGPTIVVTPNIVGTLTNIAQVTSTAADPNPGNNEATENTSVFGGK